MYRPIGSEYEAGQMAEVYAPIAPIVAPDAIVHSINISSCDRDPHTQRAAASVRSEPVTKIATNAVSANGKV